MFSFMTFELFPKKTHQKSNFSKDKQQEELGHKEILEENIQHR